MSLELLSKTITNIGISTDQAIYAIEKLSSYIPPFTDDDILRIKMNPSLSIVNKIQIIRNMKKQMKGEFDYV